MPQTAPRTPKPHPGVGAVPSVSPPSESAAATEPTKATEPTQTSEGDGGAPPADPLVIEHDGRRYGVGRADHIAVVGDWRCDGVATPAVLDPSSGLVAFFADWPTPGSGVTAAHTRTVPDAVDLRVDPDTCGAVRVVQPAGSTLINPEFS